MKTLNAKHTVIPRVINVDCNPSYPTAIESAKVSGYLPQETIIRRVKYLNNNVKSDHRRIKRLVNHGLGFHSFNTARKSIRGYEAMHMIRKDQICGAAKNYLGQMEFINSLFGVAA